MAVQMPRRRFSVAEYEQMAAAGILKEGDRLELIAGEIVEMPPIGSNHADGTNRLNRLITRQVGDDVIVSVQNPIRLDPHSEPQPDIALLRPRSNYAEALPTAFDVILLIEVSDSSLGYDRGTKLPRYAAALIPEVFIMDIGGQALEAHSEPRDGAYRLVRRVGRGQALQSVALPALTLRVDDLFG